MKARYIRCPVCRAHGAVEYRVKKKRQREWWLANGKPVAIGAAPVYCKRHQSFYVEDQKYYDEARYAYLEKCR